MEFGPLSFLNYAAPPRGHALPAASPPGCASVRRTLTANPGSLFAHSWTPSTDDLAQLADGALLDRENLLHPVGNFRPY